MSLTQKLLMSLVVATSLIKAEAVATASTAKGFNLDNFVKTKLIRNKSVKVLGVKKIGEHSLKNHGDWKAYMLIIDTKIGKREQKFPETIFVNEKDNLVTMSLLDMATGDDIGKDLRPALPSSYYDERHLILGSASAPNKLVVFSDPQCPFCKDFMPKLIKDVEKNPDKIAVYYYHMPLTRIHPVSGTLVKVMEHLQQKGKTKEALNLYNLKINVRERNEKKILDSVKKQFNLDVASKDINSPEVAKALKEDLDRATNMMVKGTPTVYFNGKFDRSRVQYKKALK